MMTNVGRGIMKAMESEQRLKLFERAVEVEIREETFWLRGTEQGNFGQGMEG